MKEPQLSFGLLFNSRTLVALGFFRVSVFRHDTAKTLSILKSVLEGYAWKLFSLIRRFSLKGTYFDTMLMPPVFSLKGKQTNRVACGSAHTIAWSTTKPANAGRLPREVPMEFNHLQLIPLGSLRNRLMLLHHFSELVCSSIALFDLQPRIKDHLGQGPLVALDALRGVLIPSGKASSENLSCHLSITKTLDIRNM